MSIEACTLSWLEGRCLSTQSTPPPVSAPDQVHTAVLKQENISHSLLIAKNNLSQVPHTCITQTSILQRKEGCSSLCIRDPPNTICILKLCTFSTRQFPLPSVLPWSVLLLVAVSFEIPSSLPPISPPSPSDHH